MGYVKRYAAERVICSACNGAGGEVRTITNNGEESKRMFFTCTACNGSCVKIVQKEYEVWIPDNDDVQT